MSEEGFTMVKPGGRHIVEFETDGDTHFTSIVERQIKTGRAAATHLILSSDVPQWIGVYERKGFKRVTDDNCG